MGLLQILWPRRCFRLPPFELAPLQFDDTREGEELLLDDIAAEVAGGTPTMRLVHPLPSAGELHQSIERHLNGSNANHSPVSASEELRAALAELRQSLA